MKPGERDHVDGELPKVGVQLTWKSKGCRDSGHGDADEMVEIAICWIRQLKRSV